MRISCCAQLKNPPPQFNFLADIAHNPELARAARAELGGVGAEGPPGAAGQHHRAEVDRQAAVIAQLDGDAAAESEVNQSMAALMRGRLQGARGAAERVLGTLQAFAGAEAAYARTMAAVSGRQLAGECDGASLRAALDAFSQMPHRMGTAHSQVCGRVGGQGGELDLKTPAMLWQARLSHQPLKPPPEAGAPHGHCVPCAQSAGVGAAGGAAARPAGRGG